jgi:hypothetical protein
MAIEKPRLLVAWRPRGPGNFLCPGSSTRALLGAIKGVKGQILDFDTYFALLGDRVQEMLDAEEDPESALDEMYDALDQEDIAEVERPKLDRVGSKLIYGNYAFRDHFNLLGLPGDIPKRLQRNDSEAARVIKETGFENWWHNLLMKPYDPDR